MTETVLKEDTDDLSLNAPKEMSWIFMGYDRISGIFYGGTKFPSEDHVRKHFEFIRACAANKLLDGRIQLCSDKEGVLHNFDDVVWWTPLPLIETV